MDRPAGMSRKSLSCVQCGRIEPGDGRLLHCFHVLCAGECLEKSLDTENTIKCVRCGKVTLSGATDLGKSLPLASTYLYSSSGDADEQSRHPVEQLTVNLCTACDEVATHVCEDCNASTPLPYCSEHATKHSSRVRAGVLHCPRAIVSRDGRRGEKDDASRAALADDNVCQLHTGKALQWWCEYCQCLLCERCKSTGHSQQHSVVSSEEAARAKLPILNRIVERFTNTEERELNAQTATSTAATPTCANTVTAATYVTAATATVACATSSITTADASATADATATGTSAACLATATADPTATGTSTACLATATADPTATGTSAACLATATADATATGTSAAGLATATADAIATQGTSAACLATATTDATATGTFAACLATATADATATGTSAACLAPDRSRQEQVRRLPVSEVLNEIDVFCNEAQKQSEEASEKVTSFFRKLPAILDKRKQEVLEEIDVLRRKKVDRLLRQRNLLEQVNDDSKAIKRVACMMQSPCASACDVLRLSNHLEEHAAKVSKTMEDEQCPCVQSQLLVDTDESEAEERIREVATELLSVQDYGIDATNCNLYVKTHHPRVGEAVVVDVEGTDWDDITLATLKSSRATVLCRHPNGKLQRLEALHHGGERYALTATFYPEEDGMYKLRLPSGDESRYVQCCVAKRNQELRFDPSACSPRVKISADGKVAERIAGDEEEENAIVLGADEYVTGTHSWTLTLEKGFSMVGVIKHPLDHGYDEFPDYGEFFGWDAFQGIYPEYNGICNAKALPEFEDGDVLDFTLHCEQNALRVYQHRTKKTSAIWDPSLTESQPLRMMVRIMHPEDKVVIS